MTQNTLHTHRASLYGNVGLLMILVDVSMQTSICVMDEVAKLFEHVEIDIPKASTGTPSVTPLATVPGPIGNIRHEGLDGSRWDFCGPRDTAVEGVVGVLLLRESLFLTSLSRNLVLSPQ